MASEKNFESTFSQVAEKHLRDNTPFLMEHAIGFEIKDRDEDGTSGFGVYAFRIGTVSAFIPVIYREGNVSGFELLWLSDHKLMVPAVSNWVNVVKYQGQGLFGTVLSRNDVRTRAVATPESLHMVSSTFPYAIKTASEDGGVIGPDVIYGMLQGTRKDARVKGLLFDVLRESPAAVTCICKTALEDPDFADAWQKMYGEKGEFKNIVLKTKQRLEKQAEEEAFVPAYTKGVKIITDIEDPDVIALSSSQKQQLMKHGSYILDTRDVHTTVFNRKLASDMFTNPTCTGYCKVLQSDGSLKDAWVGKLRLADTYHAMDNPSGVQALVILKEKPSKAGIFPFNSIYVSSDASVENFDLGVLASKSVVLSKLKPEKGTRDISPESELKEGCAFIGNGASPIVVKTWGTSAEGKDGIRIKLDRIPGAQRKTYEACAGQDLRLGFDNTDSIRVSSSYFNVGEKSRVVDVVFGKDYFVPGNPEDFNEDLIKQAELTPLTLYSDGTAVALRVGDRYHHPVNKERAVRHLVMDYALNPGSAREVVKTACESEENECHYLLKLAKSPMMEMEEGFHVAIEQPSTITVVRGAQEAGVLLQETRDAAIRASESGNEDLFETITLTGLLNEADDGTLKKKGFLKLLRGMDETGRELFRTYYNWNERVEQFGKKDVEKLRDALRKNFKSMGDLVLFLQDKASFSHGPLENTMDGLLSENVASFE